MNSLSTVNSIRKTSNSNSILSINRNAKNVYMDFSGLFYTDFSATTTYHLSAAGLNIDDSNPNSTLALVKYRGNKLAMTDFNSTGSFSIYLKYAATTQTFPPFNFLYPNKITLHVPTEDSIVARFYSFLNPGTIVPYLISGCTSADLSGAALSGSVVAPFTEITYNVVNTLANSVYFSISGGLGATYTLVHTYLVKVVTNIMGGNVFALKAPSSSTFVTQPDIAFVSGNSYRFDVSDTSVAGYSLAFGSDEIANTTLYTRVGTAAGQTGAYVLLDLTAGYSGATIRYFELTRTGMGYTPYVNPAPAAPDNVWYKFEKGDISGTTVKNYATNTYTGTIAVPSVFGAVSLSSTNNIDSSTNVVGMSSLFLDSKQHINFSTNSASGTTNPPSALLSVSFWAKNTLTSITRKDFPIWYYGPGQDWISQNNFYISYGVWTEPSNNFISFSFNNALYWTTEAQTGTFRTDEKWHHFCVVADLTTVKLYYDASMVINKNVTNPVNTSQNYAYRYLGTDYHFNTSPATEPHFKGYFDDYRMYNSALTAADVSGLYSYRTEYAVSISGGVIYLNGIYNPIVTFVAGGRYIFDQSGNSNSSNQIMFSRVASGNPTFTDGVTVVGTPGQAGAYTRVDLSGGFTGSLYYLYIYSDI